MYNSKKRRCTTVNSHVSGRKSNNPTTSNSDNYIGNSNLPHLNIHTKSSFTTLITLQTGTDTESSISINNETFYEKNISEEISSHQNLAELIDHTCDDNGNHLLNSEEGVDATSINSINATNEIYL